MIIESAFFKLLHIWTAQKRGKYERPISLLEYLQERPFAPREFYETQFASIFANIIKNELPGLGIDIPERLVVQGYPYPDNPRKQVDIYVDLTEYVSKANIPFVYISKQNYIEVKLFGGKYTTRGGLTTTENIGYIINDILRLSLFTKKAQNFENGVPSRYLLVIFDGYPKDYIAYSNREWLEELFLPLSFPGILKKQIKNRMDAIDRMPYMSYSQTIELRLSNKKNVPDSLFNKIRNDFVVKIDRHTLLRIPFIKYSIFPLNGSELFYAFLFRLFNIGIVSEAE